VVRRAKSKFCIVVENDERCARPTTGRGMCPKHYMRWKKYGDPLYVERPWRVGPCVALVDDDGTQCGRRYYAKGYCRTHYMRMFNGKPVDGAIGSRGGSAAHPPRFCDAEGCDEPHLTHGYCLAHYQRWLAKGYPDYEHGQLDRRLYETCTVDGCENPHYIRGYCSSHAWRDRRYGDPLHPGSGTSFAKTDPAYVYIVRHDQLGAVKVGVGMANAGRDRIAHHESFGWVLIRRVDVATGAEALALEDFILELWEQHSGFLAKADMPQGGWTETIPLTAYDDAAIIDLMNAVGTMSPCTPSTSTTGSATERTTTTTRPSAEVPTSSSAA
jgi:hypothetical protein